MEMITVSIVMIPLFALGVALAFWGYKLRTSIPFLPGLCAGALIGLWTGVLLALFLHPLGILLGTILGSGLGILMGKKSEKAAFSLELFACGYGALMPLILLPVMMAVQFPESEGAISAVAGAISVVIIPAIVGALALLFRRFTTRVGFIITDSVLGGLLSGLIGGVVLNPVGLLGGLIGGVVLNPVGLLITVIIMGAGIYVQMLKTRAPEDDGDPAAQTAPVAPQDAAPTSEGAAPASGPKFCPVCGTPLRAGAKFCPKCGHALGAKV